MYIDLTKLMPVVLYILLAVLVIVLIILGIRLIRTLTKVDKVIDDVNSKMNKVDGVFNIIDKTTDYASGISDKIIEFVSNIISSLFKRKKGNDNDE